MTILVGDKQKHMTIPEGWEKVTEGNCLAGDMFANVRSYNWNVVESDDIGMPYSSFECLLRKSK